MIKVQVQIYWMDKKLVVQIIYKMLYHLSNKFLGFKFQMLLI